MSEQIKWELDLKAEPQGSSDGFWYDLTDGGYIDLEKLITNKAQLNIALKAIEILESLQDTLENNSLLNEF